MKQKYVTVAIGVALKAGEKIPSIYNDPASDSETERKADDSSLTITGRKAHEATVVILSDVPFPVLGEEGKHFGCEIRRGWDTLRIVDPLDRTKEFTKRNREFTVNIVLVQNSVPVFGIIYVPVKKELYLGIKGIGAYKCSGIVNLEDDGVALEQLIGKLEQILLKEVHDHLIVAASRSHLSPETESYIADLKKKHGSVELISGGSSIKICLVAEGKTDAYPRFAPMMEWDMTVGHVMVRAAGMEVYQAGKEEPLRYNKEDLLNPWFIVEPKKEY